ncbi:hypothetical protein BT96DRAFT_243425 [Gymnopus androsaceus JB14]|uniref:F-box domain-containing protein n=1 Tax=Gymnopus androsaceus JB14 TaxID=1447944 RepID=A0A6A4IKG6_9AGAR|nr:hypothetical protein BT96DRAFT_243425 [Gymnopus androsaceus JB14]
MIPSLRSTTIASTKYLEALPLAGEMMRTSINDRVQHFHTASSIISSMRTPIRTLPDEVILLILGYTCGTHNIFVHAGEFSEYSAPSIRNLPSLSLNAVFHYWRTLLRSSSMESKWSKLKLYATS